MPFVPLAPARPIVIDALYTVHYFEHTSSYSFAGEAHDFWEFVYVDKGTVHVSAAEREYDLSRGQMIFHAPGEFHTLRANGMTAPDLVVISFHSACPAMDSFRGLVTFAGAPERTLMGRIVEESAAAFATPLNDPRTTALARRESTPFGAEQIIVAALEELLIRLLRRERGLPARAQLRSPENDDWLAGITAYLTQRLDQPLSLEQICRDHLIGRSHLQKRMHAQTGGGVMAYFTHLKIQAARRLIREGRLNVTEVASHLGYQSVHYFSRQFKQHTGMSPSEYARSVKMLLGVPNASADDRANNT